MKRWTIRILICLILGAATTVGVAWGLILTIGGLSIPIEGLLLWPQVRLDEPYWSASGVESGRVTLVESNVETVAYLGFNPEQYRTQIPHWSIAQTRPTYADMGRGVLIFEAAAGWPCVSNLTRKKRANGVDESSLIDRLPFDQLGERALPLRPIFPGFLLNTLFYAAIWFAIFFGLSAARRTYRRKRGRCIKCGYDLRGGTLPSPSPEGGRAVRIEGCPECGWQRGS